MRRSDFLKNSGLLLSGTFLSNNLVAKSTVVSIESTKSTPFKLSSYGPDRGGLRRGRKRAAGRTCIRSGSHTPEGLPSSVAE